MSLSQQQRRLWGQKLRKLSRAARTAEESLLAGIYEARMAGLPQGDVADSVDGISKSGVKAKEIKGQEIYERRRRGPKPT